MPKHKQKSSNYVKFDPFKQIYVYMSSPSSNEEGKKKKNTEYNLSHHFHTNFHLEKIYKQIEESLLESSCWKFGDWSFKIIVRQVPE